ncbi:MAG: WXG100 family type VII secretion target [Clostridia bacterium]|nr:WXG100 family type VII secretion target [Clostridia bacterium]
MYVDYEGMPAQAKQMRETGKSLNQELLQAYASIGDMHKSWYGKRYNALVEQFNNLIPQLNQMLTTVAYEVPVNLEKIANNYSQADKGQNCTTVVDEKPTSIANLSMPNDVGMHFVESEVEEVKNKVSNNFRNAKERMNEFGTQYEKIRWENSAAAEEFKVQFEKLKSTIISAFDQIEADFKSLMNQTQQDMQNVESANTVK